MRLKRMDLHVHSSFSSEEVPGLEGVTFSPRESPEEIYRLAKARGMDYVTITDHDTVDGCLAFLAAHPGVDDFVVGEEVSTELPISGLTVHVNVYGHGPAQHADLQRLRPSAFDVVRYCLDAGLFCCWNHPIYRENLSRIEAEEFTRLLDLAPVLEVRNGTRAQVLNVLAEELALGARKPVQGGSDTHIGHVGEVYTAVPCDDLGGFFAGILERRATVVGAHSTPRNFLLHVYRSASRKVLADQLAASSSALQRLRLRAIGMAARAFGPLWCAATSPASSTWRARHSASCPAWPGFRRRCSTPPDPAAPSAPRATLRASGGVPSREEPGRRRAAAGPNRPGRGSRRGSRSPPGWPWRDRSSPARTSARRWC